MLSNIRLKFVSISGLICILNLYIVSTVSGHQDFLFDNANIGEEQIVLPEPTDTTEIIQLRNFEKEISKCGRDENIILLSFVLRSHQWNEIIDKKKDKALNKLSKFFAVPKNFISLDNVSRKEIFEMTQLSSRRGLSRLSTGNSRNLGRLQFMIGCGKKLFSSGQSIANQIAEQMVDGTINEISSLDFGLWAIWSKPIDNRVPRNKRELPPIEGSGEMNYNDEDSDYGDEDYDDEISDGITETPIAGGVSKHRHHHGEPVVANEISGEEQIDQIPTTDHFNIVASEPRVHNSPIAKNYIPTTTADNDYLSYDDDINEDEDDDKLSEIPTVRSVIMTTEKIIVPITTEVSTTAETTTEKVTLPSTTTTELPTTTPTTTTEYVEIKLVNRAPVIKTRMPKQPLTAGKPFSLKVPMDIFNDEEDGTNLELELFDKYDNALQPNSWIQFDKEKREVYGLPLDDAVSKWIFHLRATDKEGSYVTETLDLTVQQHKTHRSDNHEIYIGVKLISKFKSNVDWQIRLIRGIAGTLDEASTSNIVVREIRAGVLDQSSATFVYTNESLPKDKCPEDKLEQLIQKLKIKDLEIHLSPEIEVKSVQGELIGACKKSVQIITDSPSQAPRNLSPIPRNAVDKVNATIGHLLVFKVPSDTFFDPENLPLKLSLYYSPSNKLNDELVPLEPKNWLQFDSKNNEFYGIPKNFDHGEREYLLVAEDVGGLTANDAIVVNVHTSSTKSKDYNVLFEMILKTPYDNFNNSLQQRKFVERLAKHFDEGITSNIYIRSVRPHYGNTLVSFYNTTLFRSNQECPHNDIETVKNLYMWQDGSLRDKTIDALGDFKLINITMVPVGACLGSDTINHDAIVPTKSGDPPAPQYKDDYLLTFVLPAVIILAMLLFASIVACYLHRRRLTGKMELGDEEERRSFRSKGIPVIFQDELDEKPEIGNKSPVILKDEKPPLLPPSYNSTNPDESEDVDDYVPPPAVLMGGRDSRGKSPVTPSYRKPPPYVSP